MWRTVHKSAPGRKKWARECALSVKFFVFMKKTYFAALCCLMLTLASCADYNRVLKTTDYVYKYEAAKQYYMEGQYNRAATLLGDVLSVLKGTEEGEESLYLMGLCNMEAKSYDAAATAFRKYYQTYPRGKYTETARFNCAKSLYETTPEPRLDQTATYEAVTEFQNFIEAYPTSTMRADAQDMIFKLQDKLVEKEYLSAKLYYDLGSYIGNGVNGNYGACIVTAENAIKDYPYTSRREDFAMLILKAKFSLARQSVEEKKEERFHNAIDEYYGFVTEYPESKYMKEATAMFEKAKAYVPASELDGEDGSAGK